MARGRRLLTALVLLAQAGCAVGVQQAMILPWMHGNWMYTGTKFVARDTAGATMPIGIAGDSGDVQSFGTATQILLAVDTPFARVSIAPALLGNANVELVQLEALYKHLIFEEPGRRWWLLAGLSMLALNTGVAYTTHPSANVTLNGRKITTDDVVDYTARHDISGLYAELGVQTELTGWCHGYFEVLVRLSRSDSQVETMSVLSGDNGGVVNLSTPAAGLTIDRQLQGSVTTNYDVPGLLMAVGIHFNLPSYHVTRRFVSWHGGDPALDDAPPEPELPADVSPAHAATPTAP